MSFILDALRKSETERRRGAAPSISHFPIAAPRSRAPRWVWAVICALAIGILAIGGAWWTTSHGPAPISTATVAETPNRSVEEPIRSAPARAEESQGLEPSIAEEATLPSAYDLRAAGVPLPPLELQMIVDAEDAAQRFVYINGFQYRQGQRIQNGPVVVSINRERVVLRHQGSDFVLLPE